MYEENNKPLPPGDATSIFADVLASIQREVAETPAVAITPDNVVQWARRNLQPSIAGICRRLLLPGSGLVGVENLVELSGLAANGSSCIVCLNHRSNLDVPTLYVLLEDHHKSELFHRIIWIAGRKLQEDMGLTPMLVQGVNRVVVTPTSWMTKHHSEVEIHAAHQVNIAAHRAIHELRSQGWVFGLFPAGTRIRPHDKSTTRAIEETDSYVKNFEFMVLARIDGCTLPVTRDRDLTHETPTLDRMRYTFGKVQRTIDWRTNAARRFADLPQRAASAEAIMQDIEALSGHDVTSSK
jgi:glycerol-3-phosphate O-acyltransferase